MDSGFSFNTYLVIAGIGLFLVGTIFGIMVEIEIAGPIAAKDLVLLAVGPIAAWQIIQYIFRQLRERDEKMKASRGTRPPGPPAA